MTPDQAASIISTTTAALSTTLTSILPVALPTLIVLGLLVWAIHKFVK